MTTLLDEMSSFVSGRTITYAIGEVVERTLDKHTTGFQVVINRMERQTSIKKFTLKNPLISIIVRTCSRQIKKPNRLPVYKPQ
jgi:hypothetical protein